MEPTMGSRVRIHVPGPDGPMGHNGRTGTVVAVSPQHAYPYRVELDDLTLPDGRRQSCHYPAHRLVLLAEQPGPTYASYGALIDALAQDYVTPSLTAEQKYHIRGELARMGVHEDVWQGDVYGAVERIRGD